MKYTICRACGANMQRIRKHPDKLGFDRLVYLCEGCGHCEARLIDTRFSEDEASPPSNADKIV